jgi:ribosomal protein S16
MALKLLVKGMPLRGVAEVLGIKLDTVRHWLRVAAAQSEKVDQLLMRELRVSQVELDALWTFVKKNSLRQRANLWKAKSGSA